MSWIWIAAVALLAFAAAALTGSALRLQAERRRRFDEAVGLWAETQPDQRAAVLATLAQEAVANAPAWYLLGCAHLHDYETKLAARAFGMAHHADCNLESAALLTFACLKASDGPDSDVVEQIFTTWEEMRRPDLLSRSAEYRLMACLGAGAAPPSDLSSLGSLAWLVVGPALRPKVQALLSPLAD
mgnify:CR=1 FL=1